MTGQLFSLSSLHTYYMWIPLQVDSIIKWRKNRTEECRRDEIKGTKISKHLRSISGFLYCFIQPPVSQIFLFLTTRGENRRSRRWLLNKKGSGSLDITRGKVCRSNQQWPSSSARLIERSLARMNSSGFLINLGLPLLPVSSQQDIRCITNKIWLFTRLNFPFTVASFSPSITKDTGNHGLLSIKKMSAVKKTKQERDGGARLPHSQQRQKNCHKHSFSI